MIEICLYFERHKLLSLVSKLLTLDDNRPVFYSLAEKLSAKEKKDNQIINSDKFIKFVESNPTGFCLHAKNCSYNLSCRVNEYAKLFMYPKKPMQSDMIKAFFRITVCAEPKFGYAAERDEYLHRNRIHSIQGKNKIESWVGRDLSKYLPGLYCYTLISKGTLDLLKVDRTELIAAALSVDTLNKDKSIDLLNYFEEPTDWPSSKEQLDALCNRAHGVFAKEEVEKQALTSRDFMELSTITNQWK
jgi:hypothetical protein